MREDALPQPVSPVRRDQAGGRAALLSVFRESRRADDVALRYFTVYGPRQRPDMAFHRFIRAALDGEPITLYGDGEQTRDFTFVTDAVAATIAAGERGVPGRAYNIGGGSRVSVNQVSRSSGASPASRSTSAASRRRRATCATRMPTRRWRAPTWDSPRGVARRGLEAEYRWLVDHACCVA